MGFPAVEKERKKKGSFTVKTQHDRSKELISILFGYLSSG